MPARAPGGVSRVLIVMAGACAAAAAVAAVGLTGLPLGQRVLDEHFDAIQLATCALWVLTVLSLVAAPVAVAREIGAGNRNAISHAVVERARLPRILGLALGAHGAAFATWPASLLVGSAYTFAVFRAHMMLTMSVVVTATVLALLELHAWRTKLASIVQAQESSA